MHSSGFHFNILPNYTILQYFVENLEKWQTCRTEIADICSACLPISKQCPSTKVTQPDLLRDFPRNQGSAVSETCFIC